MASITDTVKDNLKRSSAPWRNFRNQEVLPPWAPGAGIIIGVLAVIGLTIYIVLSFMNAPDIQVQNNNQPVAQNINPYQQADDKGSNYSGTGDGAVAPTDTTGSSSTPSANATNAATSLPSEASIAERTGDYSNQVPASIRVLNSSVNAKVPQGAVNLASDAAKATIDGDWENIPVAGQPDVSEDVKGATVDYKRVYLYEPVKDGANEYKFVMDAVTQDGQKTPLVISVIKDGDSFKAKFQ